MYGAVLDNTADLAGGRRIARLARVRGGDGPQAKCFQTREKLMSIGDDFWIEGENLARSNC